MLHWLGSASEDRTVTGKLGRLSFLALAEDDDEANRF